MVVTSNENTRQQLIPKFQSLVWHVLENKRYFNLSISHAIVSYINAQGGRCRLLAKVTAVVNPCCIPRNKVDSNP
jgi:hypothetical protein